MEILSTTSQPTSTAMTSNANYRRLRKGLLVRDFICDKPRKKRFGTITFLYPKDGERFPRGARGTAPLTISYCHGRLKSNMELAGVDVPERCDFVGDLLLEYSPEVQWLKTGIIKFQKLSMIVDVIDRRRIRRPITTIVSLKYGWVVGQCLVYQSKVSTAESRPKIEKLKDWELNIYRHNLLTARPVLTMPTELQRLQTQLAECTRNSSLLFGILFQLQALAQNVYLRPTTVLQLTARLRTIFIEDKVAGRKTTTADSLVAVLEENQKEIQDGIAYREELDKETPNMAKVHRVNVTPTRITLHGPEMEPQNRILRKFPNHHEYFTRVQFCDENGEDLLFNAKVSYEQVFERFKHVMTSGIQIADRLYNFLGFFHSSLRSHAVWVSSPFVDDNGHMQTYFSIISATGKFSHITSPARCAARIGQAFTEMPFMVPLKRHDVRVSTIPDRTSPDGSRVFSDGVGIVSQDVMEMIWANIPSKRGNPTCLQNRLGGAKGMLATDVRLPHRLIQIRPSMVKFDSEDMHHLEICNVTSRPYPMVLNRQVIKIQQNAELECLRTVTVSTDRAAKFLKDRSAGLDYKKDGFLRTTIRLVISKKMNFTQHLTRFEGRYAAPPGPGQILVTRSPALHDGDIQRAQNVVPPEGHPLCYHRNCVVSRDLDGDLYRVIWDPHLANVPTSAPADYPQVGDMAEFFVKFMRTDILGMTAVRPMIMADQSEQGTGDPDCRTLAGLHSTEVDFSKTGIPVNICSMAPGPQTRLYSKSNIGLEPHVSHANYDDNDNDYDIEKPYHYYNSFIEDCMKRCKPLARVSIEEHYGEARRIKAAYEDAIIDAMDSYSGHPTKPISELEIVIGSIINRRFDRIVTWITSMMRREEIQDSHPDGLELSWACLHLGIQGSYFGRRKEVCGEIKSSRVVAACALLAKVNHHDKTGLTKLHHM
ncbi:RNA dependent RNA polymerase-domain-containing protein [Aspergillus alliaceus]|uniref:RNA-dependent RNA polymerase n=1 Tax=Petromyces alliaceus TaxID=209559 RepID=A0A5N7BUY7_PETAA|nr:RNA dependent RNA polymerase-domain-containing protein [Aspergillus alliaceus]